MDSVLNILERGIRRIVNKYVRRREARKLFRLNIITSRVRISNDNDMVRLTSMLVDERSSVIYASIA